MNSTYEHVWTLKNSINCTRIYKKVHIVGTYCTQDSNMKSIQKDKHIVSQVIYTSRFFSREFYPKIVYQI